MQSWVKDKEMTMNEIHIKKSLEWRLNVVMSERRIKTVTELKRRLDAIGVSISSAQLGRVVWERPQKINIDLLEGLVTVLECSVSDILRVDGFPNPPKERKKTDDNDSVTKTQLPAKPPKPRVKPVLTSSPDDLTGPKLTSIPLPIPLRKQ
jgi:DNA-binding Xre family transcriptional regulator